MKKLLKRVSALAFGLAILLCSFTPMDVHAANNTVIELEASASGYEATVGISPYSTTFIDCTIDMYFDASGMHISINTSTTKTASVIGAKDIVIEKKNLFTWTTVATSSGGEVYNSGTCVVNLTYPYAELGETYRVSCTHYADVDGYRELPHESGNAICVY